MCFCKNETFKIISSDYHLWHLINFQLYSFLCSNVELQCKEDIDFLILDMRFHLRATIYPSVSSLTIHYIYLISALFLSMPSTVDCLAVTPNKCSGRESRTFNGVLKHSIWLSPNGLLKQRHLRNNNFCSVS